MFDFDHTAPRFTANRSAAPWCYAGRIMGVVVAWLFLNALVNLHYPIQPTPLAEALRPAPEIAALVALLAVAMGLGLPFGFKGQLFLTAAVLLLRLFQAGEVLARTYFNRDLSLYIDVQYLPDLIHLLYHTLSPVALIGYGLLTLVLASALTAAVWLSWRAIGTGLRSRFVRTGYLAVLMVLVGAQLWQQSGRARIWARPFAPRVVAEAAFILKLDAFRKTHLDAMRASSMTARSYPNPLNRLQGADVLLFFIESYGHTLFADPRHFAMIKGTAADLEQSLAAAGYRMCSNFLNSPTFGGASWLSHATVASGYHLNNQLLYNLLITSNMQTMAEHFNQAGYRTISVMPGTVWPWPEGRFFKFKQKYYARHFDYRGPAYGWSPMPDQYVLHAIHRREVQNRLAPLFIEYVLTSSHAPFHQQPPYVADWSKIGNGELYHRLPVVSFPIQWPDLTDAAQAYAAAIGYEYNILGDYLTKLDRDDALIIIMGDHQPTPQLTGPAAPWSVPVHVISRNKTFLDPFLARGYTPGIVPRQPPPHLGMEELLPQLLADFSSVPPERQ